MSKLFLLQFCKKAPYSLKFPERRIPPVLAKFVSQHLSKQVITLPMKTKSLASLLVLTCSLTSIAASNEADPAAKQLQIYPKNLARQHVGTNLFLFNAANQTYTPTEAAAAWLDDDITTGWPIMAGKQHYMLSLSEPQLLTNFSISARPAAGTVSIYASDEPAPPGAKSWAAVAKDVSLDAINQKKLAKPFSRFGKYVLIETDIADPGPLFSLYLYGDRPAVSYNLRKRDQTIDTRAIFGAYVNNQTSFNLAGLYAGGRVAHATAPDGFVSWQKAVDDNPESSMTLAPTTNQSGAVFKLGTRHGVSRLAVLADTASKGKLDFFLVAPPAGEATPTAAAGTDAEFVQVNIPSPAAAAAADPVSLDGMTPTMTMVLDGNSARHSIDFAQTQAARLFVRWTPDNGTDTLNLREMGVYNELTLGEYELAMTPEAIAELGSDPSKDGKSFKDFKGENLPVVASGPGKSPYLPGALGFPPVLTSREARRLTREPEPLSP